MTMYIFKIRENADITWHLMGLPPEQLPTSEIVKFGATMPEAEAEAKKDLPEGWIIVAVSMQHLA